jgi:hypothetical protein
MHDVQMDEQLILRELLVEWNEMKMDELKDIEFREISYKRFIIFLPTLIFPISIFGFFIMLLLFI